MTASNFAVFILTNGRANNVITYNKLRKHGYSGKIYLLIDDEDSQIEAYKEKYKDQVVVFPKQKAIDMTDSGDCKTIAVVESQAAADALVDKYSERYPHAYIDYTNSL